MLKSLAKKTGRLKCIIHMTQAPQPHSYTNMLHVLDTDNSIINKLTKQKTGIVKLDAHLRWHLKITSLTPCSFLLPCIHYHTLSSTLSLSLMFVSQL